MKSFSFIFTFVLISAEFVFAQTTSFRYEGRIQGPGISTGSMPGQTVSASIRRADGCGGTLGLAPWSSAAVTFEDGAFSVSPTFTADALSKAMDPWNTFSGTCSAPYFNRELVITWGAETFIVSLEDSPRATRAAYASNADKIGNTNVEANLACAGNEVLKFNSGTTQFECQALVATDIPVLGNSQIPAPGGDLSGTLSAATVTRIRNVGVSSTAPTTNQVLKYDGSNWVPSADATGAAVVDSTYAAKGIVQINTDLATSGLFISSGVLSLPNTITAGTAVGDAQNVPVITYDQKGRLTAVSTISINDTSKLPTGGGTMTGPINMGAQNITNAANISSSSVSATDFSGRSFYFNDGDASNTIRMMAPSVVSTDYILTLPPTAGTNGQVLTTNGTGTLSWSSAAGGSVTGITSGNSYMSVNSSIPATPALTINVGSAANTVAAGDDSRIVGALPSAAYNVDLAQAALCTSAQTPYWNTVSDLWACQNIIVANFSGALVGDVSGSQSATSVDRLRGQTISAGTSPGQLMVYDGTSSWINRLISGDATMTSTGVMTLANTIGSSGSTGTAALIPVIGYDAKGRITSASSVAHQDATAAQKGIVQVGSNLSVSSGTISLSGANVTSALGYIPFNKNGDNLGGTLGFYQTPTDPPSGGWTNAERGYTWYNTTSNELRYWDGSSVRTLGVAGSGLSSLAGQTGASQSFANGTSGTAPLFSSSSNVHTLNIPLASAAGVSSGTISKTDYDFFAAKLSSPLTTKGDLLTRDATSHIRFPAGIDGQVLAADSAEVSGLRWVTPAVGAGDITDVLPGTGLTGGASTGSATLGVDVGTAANQIPQIGGLGLALDRIVMTNSIGNLKTLSCTDGQVIKYNVSGQAVCGTDDSGFLNGGNSFGGVASLGTNDGFGLALETSGTTKLFIATSGDVGIGAFPTPKSKLDVDGGINVRGQAFISGPADSSEGLIYFNSTDGKFKVSEDGGAYTNLVNTDVVSNSDYYGVHLLNAACTNRQTASWSGSSWVCQDIDRVLAGGFITEGGNSFPGAMTVGTNNLTDLNLEANGTTGLTLTSGGDIVVTPVITNSKFRVDKNLTQTSGTSIASQFSTFTLPSGAGSANYFGTKNDFNINGTFNITTATATDIQINNNTNATVLESTGLNVNNRRTLAGSTSLQTGISSSVQGTNGSIVDAIGLDSEVRTDTSTGNITNAIGISSKISSGTSSTMANALGMSIDIENNGIPMTSSTGLDVQMTGSGTATNSFGIKIGNIIGSNKFGLYQSDATAKNFFSGNVGIGTTTPAGLAPLHIYRSINSNMELRLENASNGASSNSVVSFWSEGTNYGAIGSYPAAAGVPFGARMNMISTTGINLIGSGGDIRMITGGISTERLRIDGVGKVGIGTTNPSSRLDIVDTDPTTSALIVPRAAAFTGTAIDGMVRYNTSSNLFEFRQNGAWQNYTTVSDGRLKTNVVPVSDALDIVNQLNPVFYDWDRNNPRTASFAEKHEVGFIAQEVEQVLPEVVNRGEDSYRSVEYGKIVAVAIAAIKEMAVKILGLEASQKDQDREIASMKAENEALKKENDAIKARLDKIEQSLQQR